jgi:hypothetical protein
MNLHKMLDNTNVFLFMIRKIQDKGGYHESQEGQTSLNRRHFEFYN